MEDCHRQRRSDLSFHPLSSLRVVFCFLPVPLDASLLLLGVDRFFFGIKIENKMKHHRQQIVARLPYC